MPRQSIDEYEVFEVALLLDLQFDVVQQHK